MAKNFASLAFTDAIKEMQEKMGSRRSYARLEERTYIDGLTEHEIGFIAGQDSFYMATIGENGYPYIQHRGGPKGFVKVLSPTKIGFMDFSGNMQYVSVGNIQTNDKVSLIMVDYPSRTRLKVLAKASIVELNESPELYQQLDLPGYKFKPERMFVLDVEAYDWNCPQHIIPRNTVEDIQEAFASQADQIAALKEEVKKLKEALGKV